MFKNYKKLYIEEREDKELCKKWKDYYAELVGSYRERITDYKAKIAYYETACKKIKRLSNIGFWCGICSLVFVIVSMILKAVL